MRRQAMPESEWQRRRGLGDTVRLVRDFILGALALLGFIALMAWLFLVWKPS